MKESHTEGITDHGVPESCVGSRKAVGEALTGVCMGTVLSREIKHFRTLTLLTEAESNTGVSAIVSWYSVRRGRRPVARTEPFYTRTGRSQSSAGQMEPYSASERLMAVTR